MRNRDMPAVQYAGMNDGLTKREAAAIAVMQGMLAANLYEALSPQQVASGALMYADALWDRLEGTDGE